MASFRVTKCAEIDYGHRVPRHESKCRNVHGHRGKIEVTIEGQLVNSGSSEDMVMDFGHIKVLLQREIVAKLDHCMIISAKDCALKSLLTDLRDLEDPELNQFGLRYEIDGFGVIQELMAG